MWVMGDRLRQGLPDTFVLWDVDHTLIENGGVSKEGGTLRSRISKRC